VPIRSTSSQWNRHRSSVGRQPRATIRSLMASASSVTTPRWPPCCSTAWLMAHASGTTSPAQCTISSGHRSGGTHDKWYSLPTSD
jgi:hypothetical protein